MLLINKNNTRYTFAIAAMVFLFLINCNNPDESHQLSTKEKQKIRKLESWTYWYTNSKNGHPFITNFELPEGADFLNQDMIQDDEQNMLLANRKGISIFDGKHQGIVQMANIPLALEKLEETGQIFVGCKGDYGILIKDKKGVYKFESFSETKENKIEYSHILTMHDTVYFCSSESIKQVQVDEDSDYDLINSLESKTDSLFSGFFIYKNTLFVNVSGKGLHKLESNKLKLLADTNYLASQEILFSFTFDEESLLLGTNKSKLYKFTGNNLTEFLINDKKYISENMLSAGTNLSSSEFVLATSTGGCVIVSKDNGDLIVTINYQNGLPDDEIFSVATDDNKGLWLAHGFGVSRIDFSLPIKSFGGYPGLEGNLSSVIDYDGTIYVATTEGLFYLTKVSSYKDVRQYVNKRRFDARGKSDFKQKWHATLKIWGEKGGGGLNNIHPSQKNYALQSFKYMFKQIAGLNKKCKQLVKYKDRLLVATNNGIYEVNKRKAKPVVSGKYINSISPTEDKNTFYFGANEGLFVLSHKKKKWNINKISHDFNQPVYSIAQTGNKIWVGSDNAAYSFSKIDGSFETYNFNKLSYEQITVCEINKKPAFLNTSGIYEFNEENNKILVSDTLNNYNISSYFSGSNGLSWFKTGGKWLTYNEVPEKVRLEIKFFNLFDNVKDIHIDAEDNAWVIAGNSLYKVSGVNDDQIRDFNMYIHTVSNISSGEVFELDDMSIAYGNNSLRFNVAAPFFANPQSTKYSYYINGLSDKWSEWTGNTDLDFPFLPPGKYTIDVKAKNAIEQISKPFSFQFEIEKPFWSRWWFIILALIIIVYVVHKLFRARTEYLEKENEKLEGIITKRTTEIRIQKEKIEQQHAVVTQQNEKITASIGYASRIQNAVLPQAEYIKQLLPQHFILFKPKNIVSGDFYWLKEKNGFITFAVADCTGHGVPGAFMSMLGISFLNDIVANRQINSAGDILDQLRLRIKSLLKQEDAKRGQKDGMDIALYVIDTKKMELQFAGAYNPLYIIRKNSDIDEFENSKKYKLLQANEFTLIEIKADKQPIAIYIKEKEFSTHNIKLKKGDILYTFSDGFIDQTGGVENRKYMSKKFKKLLLDINQEPTEEQKKILDDTIESWKNGTEQVDDILVAGIRV